MTVRRLFAGAACAVLLAPAAPAGAQVPAGPEFQVNTYTTGGQEGYRQFIAHAPDGAFVIAWTDAGLDGSGHGVFAQRFDAAGTRQSAAFQVNTYTTGFQELGGLAVDGRGSFVIAWEGPSPDGDYDVFARLYARDGAPSGVEFRVNGSTSGEQGLPSVAASAHGAFVVAWTDTSGADGSSSGSFARRFDASGQPIGGDFQVNTYTTGQQYATFVGGDPGGRFVVVWSSRGQDGQGAGVFGQRFDSDGVRVGAEFQANTYTTGNQSTVRVALRPDGSFLMTWFGAGPGDDIGVFVRGFDADGVPQGPEVAANSTVVLNQAQSGIAMDAAGNAVVTWLDTLQEGVSNAGIFARRLDAAGAFRGPEFHVNTYTTGVQSQAAPSLDAAGNFVVAWKSQNQDGSSYGVFAQRFGGLLPAALAVDTPSGGGAGDQNRVLEPGETVDVRPSWRNASGAGQSFAGTLSNIAGPGGATYTITDGAADYGTAPDGSTQPCAACYAVSVSNPPQRPALHWDVTADEALAPDAQGQRARWTLHVGDSFADVPEGNPFYRFVETLLHHGVTGGCGAGVYCPDSSTTREQMAAFVLVAREGAGFTPPPCGTPLFADVPAASPFCRFVEELARRGVVSGCGGGNYCPTAPVTREQMAVFVLRTLDPTLLPPACTTPVFADVPAASPFCRWIEELARRGVVTGCGGGSYCPGGAVTRAQMGVFLGATFGLALYGP